MAVFTIYDGRTSFWQWDLGQRLVVSDDVCCEVHFCNGTSECALVCKVYSEDDRRVVDVPNVLLQSAEPMRVFAHVQSEGDEHTTYSEIFTVIPRTKPDDYVYTETEVWTAEKAVAEALQEAKESGEFKGDPGPKGDPGVVKFVVVTELPQEDTENAIYLLPSDGGGEENLFDEYIFVDGKWEKIGSAAVAVDLDEYVKKTDYATADKPGVAKVDSNYGITLRDNTLFINSASKIEIAAKGNGTKPITPSGIDVAVKAGITTNTETLTDEEKTAACEWLGAVEKMPPATGGQKPKVYCNAYNNSTGDYTVVVDGYSQAGKFTIPTRNSEGGIYIPDASISDDTYPIPAGEVAVNKKYVDGRITANEDGTLTILLADGSKYKVNATKEE